MREELISFDTAKLAKEKGFDEPCIDTYKDVELYRHKAKRYNSSFNQQWKEEPIKNSTMSNAKIPRYSAPTQSLLQKFIREVHNIDITISLVANGYGFYIHKDRNYTNKGENYGISGITYEEALEKGLQEALKQI